MHEESVEAVGNSDLGFSSNDGFVVHGLGVPHDELRLLCSAIIYERHEVAVIF